MTRNIQMQGAAVDILGFTVKQGLAHPLQASVLRGLKFQAGSYGFAVFAGHCGLGNKPQPQLKQQNKCTTCDSI